MIQQTPEDIRTLTLVTFADGAAQEVFNASLAEVLANLEDPNTDWKSPRSILLKFSFSQDEERVVGAVKMECAKKLAGLRGVTKAVTFGRHKGQRVAV